MKTIITMTITALVTATTTYFLTIKQLDLIIYTSKDIHYIKGLETYSETDSIGKKFKTLTEVKDYVEFVTASELSKDKNNN